MKYKLLGEQESLTVFEAAQLMTQGNGGLKEAEKRICAGIVSGKLPAEGVHPEKHSDRFTFYDSNGINKMMTAVRRSELDKWLRDEGLPPIGAVSSVPEMPQVGEPLQRQRHQEKEILRVIKELQYDAKALPKCKPGKSGVKAEVRQKLKFTVKVFDKAWDRLRTDKEIQDAQ